MPGPSGIGIGTAASLTQGNRRDFHSLRVVNEPGRNRLFWRCRFQLEGPMDVSIEYCGE
jgi:hypothetical protein